VFFDCATSAWNTSATASDGLPLDVPEIYLEVCQQQRPKSSDVDMVELATQYKFRIEISSLMFVRLVLESLRTMSFIGFDFTVESFTVECLDGGDLALAQIQLLHGILLENHAY
jgi:hypothetical protein